MRFVLLAAAVLFSGALHAQDTSKAKKACEGKPAAERRECMRRELCAQARDPKACEQQFTKGREPHAKRVQRGKL